MSLHPQVVRFLADLRSANPKPVEKSTPQEIRAAVRAGLIVAGEPETVAHVEDCQIPGPGGEIPLRIYRPAETRCRGALAYFHGGGWVAGDLDTHDALCRALANESAAPVVAVDYRLAPEHTYPAAVEDAHAAFQWLQSNAATLDADPDLVAVGGDSAGGNLAAVVSLMARDRGERPPCGQVLVYPVTDFRFDGASYQEYADGFGLTAAGMQCMWRHYLGDETLASEPYASPLRADDHKGLPPALLMTAKYDVLFDDGEQYATRLQSAGVVTERIRHDDMIHGFLGRLHTFDAARTAVQQIATGLRECFGG